METREIPESELTELIVQNLKQQKQVDAQFSIDTVNVQIRQTIQQRGYVFTVAHRVIDIMWKMMADGMLVPARIQEGHLSLQYWQLRITSYGKQFLEQDSNFYFDPDGYSAALRRAASAVDDIVVQYAVEALKCYKQGFTFAAAVMIGAAAEKAILILFDSIVKAAQDANIQSRLEKAMQGTCKMPTIYRYINGTVEKFRAEIEAFDPRAYECATHHVISLADMIRRQRNDAVHPATARVESGEVFLSMTSFPLALQVIYRLQAYFSANKGNLFITFERSH